MKSLLAASLALAAGGFFALAATPAVQDGAAAAAVVKAERKSFVVKLDGFTIEYAMVPIPASVDGQVKAVFIGRTEVPWELYDVFMLRLDVAEAERTAGVDAEARPTKAYGSPDRGFGHDGFAALGMSRLSAEKFCEWLSAKTGRAFRLPTEAEWEHAARAGRDEAKTADELKGLAWFRDNAAAKPHPIATKAANAFGLHDMFGNLCEWVAADPTRPAAKKERVAKGGAFDSPFADANAGARRVETPAWNKTDPQFPKSKWWLSDASFVGFRIVCECEETSDAAK